MKPLFKTLTAVVLGTLALAAQAEQLKVMTSGGFTAAYKLLGPQYAKQSGDTLETILGPSMGKAPEAIPNRLARGEHADVVIMVGYALDELIKQGKVDPASRVELADSRIGLVVKEGAAKPAINTDAELKAVLNQAKSVAYSDSASGVYVEKQLFKKLGMPAKGTMIERVPVGEQVAKGDYEVGLQQVAELLPVKGVTFVGKIPEDVQSVTRFAAGIPVNAEHPEQAKALLQFMASPEAQPEVQSTGLDSVSR
ncbi:MULTISPECIES: substrate-binding domain-containing protein [unclassified Pseudomonas]|uniref:substrate-binding domain-containing protein n=1 Tax=unclassified Pseudomonas TaxID=196821 RepID=UPI000C88F15B|nr:MULTISPECIES: substrate-binding domain-containing protein [unclassified Pseudomonas]MBJ2318505.1 substrate-binding domain-containing protein [Pseudomonas fluorescens]PMZ71433.1 molybdenum ABC transporter substrate-binding protein [Pseudomonas sp. GW247-3R2A]PMY75859.1 molybdenum ABC transporter substrate-binding protein [Pseudomonas sp. MPR-R3A]PMY98435.1 molybdenum ABC transporter substrate-binding protein [Pseudomonas sp. FW305-124]PNA94444.1 molybdenum ABC transporter substrate-binding p